MLKIDTFHRICIVLLIHDTTRSRCRGCGRFLIITRISVDWSVFLSILAINTINRNVSFREFSIRDLMLKLMLGYGFLLTDAL